jgi:hypothetical protein
MSVVRLNPWQMAAECRCVARTTTDSKERELLGYVEGLWLALANEAPFLTSEELATDMEVVSQIHSDMQADMAVPSPAPSQQNKLFAVLNS